MSVHILYDQSKRKSAMYCSTTGLTFGPLFNSDDARRLRRHAPRRRPGNLTPSELATAIEDWEDTFYAADDDTAPTTPPDAI